MIAIFFRQLLNSCGVVFRTFRAFFMRQIMGIRARIRRITSFSRQAARLVPKAMNSVAVAGKKPTKREDFVETKRLFVAKSFIFLLIAGVIAFGLMFYFLLWPWLQSTFFTKRFYRDDSAIEAYSGKVIVCYDEKKKEPMLQGKLKEGLLQGKGKEYDEAGRIVYDGDYVDGLYEGSGKLYKEGVLVYSGQFTAGEFAGEGSLYEGGELVYEGAFRAGKRNGVGTAYEDGAVCYTGDFTDDRYNGDGKAYYPDGTLKYQGSYVDGAYSGEGTAFFPNGRMEYKGGYLLGLYEGDGTLYFEDGSKHYEGGFANGLYQGTGVLQVDDELRAEGEFEKGAPADAITLYRGNKLYYEGTVSDDFLPDGEGKLYASDGKLIYQGAMVQGRADIGALLEMPAADVRAMFGEAKLIETPGKKAGFSINNEALGITLFCTYKQDEGDPTVYYVYAYDKNADGFVDAMPYRSAAEYEAASTGYDKQEREEQAVFTGGVPYPDGTYYRTAYYYDDYVFVGWSKEKGGDFLMVEWITLKSLPPATTGVNATGGAAKLDAALSTLGLVAAPDTAVAADANPYYGTEELSSLVNYSASKNTTLANAASYYAAAENCRLYEEELELYSNLLTGERLLTAMGNGDADKLAELEAAVNRLEIQIAKAKIEMKKASDSTKSAGIGVLGIEEYDVGTALFVVDPSKLDTEAIKETAGTSAENALMELQVTYLELTKAVNEYSAARDNALTVLDGFSKGSADEAARLAAVAARNEAAAAVNNCLAAYTKQMLELDTMTGGMVSSACGYFTD